MGAKKSNRREWMPGCQVATYLDEIRAKKNFAGESGCPDAKSLLSMVTYSNEPKEICR